MSIMMLERQFKMGSPISQRFASARAQLSDRSSAMSLTSPIESIRA